MQVSRDGNGEQETREREREKGVDCREGEFEGKREDARNVLAGYGPSRDIINAN